VAFGGEFAVAMDALALADVGVATAAEFPAAGTGVGMAALTDCGATEVEAAMAASVPTHLHTSEALATAAIAVATPQALMTQSCAADCSATELVHWHAKSVEAEHPILAPALMRHDCYVWSEMIDEQVRTRTPTAQEGMARAVEAHADCAETCKECRPTATSEMNDLMLSINE
jgi:hypothetical protein